MNLGELVNALRDTGAAMTEEVRVCVDDNAGSNAEVKEVVAGCDGVLIVLHHKCSGCEQAIDPNTCWCGESKTKHGDYDNHGFIPMGCDCNRPESHQVGN